MSQDLPKSDDLTTSQARPIVAFDFDGTLTVRDSFLAFLKWRAGPMGWVLGLARLVPATLAYLIHRDRGKLKSAALRIFLLGTPRERLEADATAFAEGHARALLRPDAVAAWKRWRADHVSLVIVTASPDVIVAPFARGLGADALIGTALAFDVEGRVTGLFATPNCRGPEKVARLRAAFGDDVEVKAAYGDTRGDRVMLAIAEITGYRVFRGAP